MKKRCLALCVSIVLFLHAVCVFAAESESVSGVANTLRETNEVKQEVQEITAEKKNALLGLEKQAWEMLRNAKRGPLPDDEAVRLDVTQLRDVTDEITEIDTLACVRAVVRDVYLPGRQKPKTCIKLYLPGTEELGCVFVDDLMVFKNGKRCDSELDCGDLVYFEKKFNGTISKVHILWDMDDKGKKNGNGYIYSNVGYWTDTTIKTDEQAWGGRGTLDTNGKRYKNELRIMYTPNMVVGTKNISIGGYGIAPDTRVLIYTRYTKSKERYRSALLSEIDLTNPERKEIFNSIVNTPENMKRVKTFYFHWTENVLKDIIIVQDVQFE